MSENKIAKGHKFDRSTFTYTKAYDFTSAYWKQNGFTTASSPDQFLKLLE